MFIDTYLYLIHHPLLPLWGMVECNTKMQVEEEHWVPNQDWCICQRHGCAGKHLLFPPLSLTGLWQLQQCKSSGNDICTGFGFLPLSLVSFIFVVLHLFSLTFAIFSYHQYLANVANCKHGRYESKSQTPSLSTESNGTKTGRSVASGTVCTVHIYC